jgi:hypothetical protein
LLKNVVITFAISEQTGKQGKRSPIGENSPNPVTLATTKALGLYPFTYKMSG